MSRHAVVIGASVAGLLAARVLARHCDAVTVVEKDACRVTSRRRIEAGDENFRAMSEAWSRALREGFSQIRI